MVRRRAFVRVLGLGCRRGALFGVVLAIAVPACGDRSIRIGEDELPTAPDDGSYGGSTSSGGTFASGGTEAGTPSGGSFPAGGTFPMGGTPAVGGTFPTGGTVAEGGEPAGGGTFPTGGTPAFGGTGVAGSIGVGGKGGTTVGGASSIGGSAYGGTTIGGASGVGGAMPAGGTGPCGGLPAPDPECRGIISDAACSPEGKPCSDLSCGLADSGRRACTCANVWACTTCDYSNSPFRDRPAAIPACSPDVADEVPCTTVNQVCGPVGSEYCACSMSCTDGLIWDCDKPPSTWQ